MAHNVPYKNCAAIAGDDFPQENQMQQVRTDFRFGTKIALFLYSVANCTFWMALFSINEFAIFIL